MSRNSDSSRDIELDRVFMALANQTRREMLVQLSRDGQATISELAEPFDMSQPGASKHVRVLEEAGLVKREIDGRVHRCEFDDRPFAVASEWMEETREFWTAQLGSLAAHFTEPTNSK